MVTMTNKLSPLDSATAASAVYDLMGSNDIGKAFEPFKLFEYFEFDNSTSSATRFTSKTGAFEFKSRTGFGVIAMGRPGSRHARDAILVCRGTASAYDWLTDANTGIHTSLTGHKVHAGFNRAFNGFARDILRFVNIHQPRTVHCVGHSLGGALASLSADLVLRKGKQAVLYTFGSPRVGLLDFASHLSTHSRMGKANIHRVYHAGDPVAMVPLWPYVHAPQPGGECYIGRFMEFSLPQHQIGNYIKSVKGQSWKTLTRPHLDWDTHVLEWLDSEHRRAFHGLNLYNLTMAMTAIRLAIKEVVGSMLVPAGLLAVSGATLLDQMSYLLDRAANLSSDSQSFIMR